MHIFFIDILKLVLISSFLRILYQQSSLNFRNKIKLGQMIISKLRRSFTLVELLVVMTILAVLMSLFVPALKKTIWRSTDLVCVNHLKASAVMLILFADDHNDTFPYRGKKRSGAEIEYNVVYMEPHRQKDASQGYVFTHLTPPTGSLDAAHSLVDQLVPYDSSSRVKESIFNWYDKTLGPNFVCPLYSGYNEPAYDNGNPNSGFYGNSSDGLKAMHHINSSKAAYMSYDLYVSTRLSWRINPMTKRFGDTINFHHYKNGSNTNVPVLLNSTILMADRVKLRKANKGNYAEVQHRPIDNYKETGHDWASSNTDAKGGVIAGGYKALFDFTQNYSMMDGSVRKATGMVKDLYKTHILINSWQDKFYTAIPIESGELP
jgi:prepilin-type N-terminal cleavage/methylation domain-containing protein